MEMILQVLLLVLGFLMLVKVLMVCGWSVGNCRAIRDSPSWKSD